MGDLRVPDLNRVFIAGRLTRDPDLRYLPSGTPYCKLGLANSRFYKNKDGNRVEETCFVDVTLWGPQAEWVGERLKKGRPVLLEGSLRTSEWEDRETGQKRSKLEINAQRMTPLDWDDDRSGGGHQGASQGGSQGHAQGGGSSGGGASPGAPGTRPQPRVIEEPIPEDDIPF